MGRVSQTLAAYLLRCWSDSHGGISHAAPVFLSLDETERGMLTGGEEGICVLKNGLAYVGVLDRQGKVLLITQETVDCALKRGLSFWPYETQGISPVLLLRLDAQLTQTALAKRAGCTQKDISRWENGVRNPTQESLHKLHLAVSSTKREE